jgi:hypothetical protein
VQRQTCALAVSTVRFATKSDLFPMTTLVTDAPYVCACMRGRYAAALSHHVVCCTHARMRRARACVRACVRIRADWRSEYPTGGGTQPAEIKDSNAEDFRTETSAAGGRTGGRTDARCMLERCMGRNGGPYRDLAEPVLDVVERV